MSSDHLPPSNLQSAAVSSSELTELPISDVFQAYGVYNHHRYSTSPPHSPNPDGTTSKRSSKQQRNSGHSHVDIDYFDPVGVRRLSKRISQVASERNEIEPFNSDDTLTASGPFDLQRTLKLVVQKKDAAHIQSRELGVMFEKLRVRGLGSSAAYFPTVWSIINPMMIFEKIQMFRNPPLRNILEGFEGVVRPGEMILVLGRPGSGCSTLLKVLANHRNEYHSIEGDVYYDSFTPEQICKYYRGDVQYCPEDDYHFPTMTVKQTLDFAAETRVPHARIHEKRGTYVDKMTEILSTIFGLRHVQNTPVGDATIRGVSGGEKKRVSIAEALATRSRIQSWDNSTRGLDSSTALEFGRALRIATDIDHQTTIVSIDQAGETLYELFDKVCVLYEGRMIYFGRADKARQYFIDLGYQPANRQTTPDFLVAVTDPNGRIPRTDMGAGAGPVPRTADEFANYFMKSDLAKENRRDMQLYKDAFIGNPERGVIVGTVFVQSPEVTSNYFSRGGVLFYSMLFPALSCVAEIPALFKQRPIVNRHAKAAMYHPFIEALSMTIVDIPITFLASTVFAILLYFISGLQSTAGQFFIYYLFVFAMCLTMRAWLRCMAAASKAEPSAQAISVILLLPMIIYAGYIIPKASMIGALHWISYANPLRYVFESIIGNEFHTLNGTCSNLVPQGPGYEGVSLRNQVCPTVGAVKGQSIVDGNDFVQLSYDFSFSHVWRNFGIVCAFAVGFIVCLLIFAEYNTSVAGESKIVLYKRGAKAATLRDTDPVDEEKSSPSSQPVSDPDKEISHRALATAPAMKDFFSWQHLKYTVPVLGDNRVLLDDVSGYVVPGTLTALMGESGAGKTTLLKVLAQRVNTGIIEGDRFVNGQPPPLDFQSQSGYCQQMDTHIPTDTVREALRFSASLRQPASVPMAEKEAYVEECLKMCGLEGYAEASVGSLNVEFKKRTTIAVELAAKPKLLLFLDKPTSGLDSQSAWAIMRFLRNLADNGQAILCTLLLLRKGGQTVYFGNLGHNATTLIDYFERNGSRQCDPAENPAEFMLDVIGDGATENSNVNWHDIWRNSPEAVATQKELERFHTEGRSRPPVSETFHSEFATPWLHQTKELLFRNSRSFWRNPTYIRAKLVLDIFAGLFIGVRFFCLE
ncbi:hypothetical protein C0992_002357 [Termitomyces sp. T32_za158]|nr:hypothetical protein C0992_002357 [Termitomyces sp. T32_za158]